MENKEKLIDGQTGKEWTNENGNHEQMGIGLSNSLEPVQTRNMYNVRTNPEQELLQ